ncbi:YgaP family membrane protein [Aliiruegeria lutimaris]|uniref:Inner membrane protein YgaP-like transmembrane domain-containing protein n=1 Tax=Aliiruegeria lutimaris TaxID=571298 RepID=A0A1G8ME69_9RHOB|nr:DUF2892 domain-containing protein [Aliiruegeria lutimaris]SDI66248.1 Protein of unknown function [Aliiruegeria lutimaris]
MTKNMGSADRIARVVIGVVLLILAFSAGWSTLWTAIAAIVGLVMLATAAMGYCPPYAILGIKTCKRDNA